MYCQECGAKIPDAAKFCPECGLKITASADIEDRPKRMYTARTAQSEYFQGTISLTTIYCMLRQGKLPHIRVGQRYLISEAALDAWREAQEQQSIQPQLVSNPYRLVK